MKYINDECLCYENSRMRFVVKRRVNAIVTNTCVQIIERGHLMIWRRVYPLLLIQIQIDLMRTTI
jgi:hypothetical protein